MPGPVRRCLFLWAALCAALAAARNVTIQQSGDDVTAIRGLVNDVLSSFYGTGQFPTAFLLGSILFTTVLVAFVLNSASVMGVIAATVLRTAVLKPECGARPAPAPARPIHCPNSRWPR